MYRVEVARTVAEGDLHTLGGPDRQRVLAKMRTLAFSPKRHKPLRGSLRGLWSVRAGAIRIIYLIDDGANRVVVVAVGRRRSGHTDDIYRRGSSRSSETDQGDTISMPDVGP